MGVAAAISETFQFYFICVFVKLEKCICVRQAGSEPHLSLLTYGWSTSTVDRGSSDRLSG